jgi:hypothetical protein
MATHGVLSLKAGDVKLPTAGDLRLGGIDTRPSGSPAKNQFAAVIELRTISFSCTPAGSAAAPRLLDGEHNSFLALGNFPALQNSGRHDFFKAGMKIQGAGVQAYGATNFTSARAAKHSMPEEVSEISSPGSTASSAVDFSSMTRNEMKKVAQHLWEEGKIDLTQLGMIQMAGPLGKAGPDGGFVPFTETERARIDSVPIDYPKLVKGAMEFIESRHEELDPRSGYANWKHILSVLEAPQTALPKLDLTINVPQQTPECLRA